MYITNQELMTSVTDKIGVRVIPTGSRVFGPRVAEFSCPWGSIPVEGDSDFDILVEDTPQTRQAICMKFEHADFKMKEVITRSYDDTTITKLVPVTTTIYVMHLGVVINFVLKRPREFAAWKHATFTCTELAQKPETAGVLATRDSRVATFKTIRTAYANGYRDHVGQTVALHCLKAWRVDRHANELVLCWRTGITALSIWCRKYS